MAFQAVSPLQVYGGLSETVTLWRNPISAAFFSMSQGTKHVAIDLKSRLNSFQHSFLRGKCQDQHIESKFLLVLIFVMFHSRYLEVKNSLFLWKGKQSQWY